MPEGVFQALPDGSQRFAPLGEPPSCDIDVLRLLATVRRRMIRLVRRYGIKLERDLDDGCTNPLALESPVLAQIQGASALGRVATGLRAGKRMENRKPETANGK